MNAGERHARYARLAAVAPDGRGLRFARRMSGAAAPSYADLASVPDWLDAPEPVRVRIATLAALLHHRHALDAELSGNRLARIAAAVGEDLLDAACEVPAPESANDRPLPRPERLAEEGRELLEAGLPLPFRTSFPGAKDDPAARALTAQARAIAMKLE